MRYCSYCLQPDTRPGEKFFENSICLACHNFIGQTTIDYEDRFIILQDILTRFSRSPGQMFDCIIGVSGGKDSTRQAVWVRDKLGLNPLLVSLSYPPQQVNQRGVQNISNLINLGFDLHFISLAPETWRLLVRAGFLKFLNWQKSTELALYSSVPQVAIQHGIKLIFNGEDPGQKEIAAMGECGWDNNNIRLNNTLSGGAMEWMKEVITESTDLVPYRYPSEAEFNKHALQIVDLGWFLGDWSFTSNGAYACSVGLEVRDEIPSTSGDLSCVSCLDEDWVILNQMIKYYKFGYSKATDYLNEEIRFGRITREKAILLVKKYDGSCGEHIIESFCAYIEMSVKQFWEHVRSIVNRQLFDVLVDGKIVSRFEVGVGL